MLKHLALALTLLAGLAACDGNDVTQPDPYGAVAGTYELRLWNDAPLPSITRERSNQISYEAGSITLTADRNATLSQTLNTYTYNFPGSYAIVGDSVVFTFPNASLSKMAFDGNVLRRDGSAYVRRGSTVSPALTYTTYTLKQLDGFSIPYFAPSIGEFTSEGYLWLFGDGTYRKHIVRTAISIRAVGTYTLVGGKLDLRPAGAAAQTGTVAGDQITVGTEVYARRP